MFQKIKLDSDNVGFASWGRSLVSEGNKDFLVQTDRATEEYLGEEVWGVYIPPRFEGLLHEQLVEWGVRGGPDAPLADFFLSGCPRNR